MISIIRKMAVRASVKRIAHTALTTEAFTVGASSVFNMPSMFISFFKKYGTTEYIYYSDWDLYVGYVNLDGIEELLCLILKLPFEDGCIIVSVKPPISFNNGLIGLLDKLEFAEQTANNYIAYYSNR